jgi:hypothetical protein
MSTKKKYLKEEDLKKFDEFIQESLNKYFYVEAWDKLYSITKKDSYDIISDNSTIPDLVIYNKSFNKNDCFLYSNKKNKYIKFPRVQFLLRPKKIKYYNPSNTYEDKKEEKDLEFLKPFEFKSIPKEIEEKYNNINKNKKSENNNVIFDELKDFMKSDNDKDNEIKVKLIKDDEQKEIDNKEKGDINNNKNNENKKRKYSNNNNKNVEKNKFDAPINMKNINYNTNINNMVYNNYLMYQNLLFKNIQFQNNNINNLKMNDINNNKNNNDITRNNNANNNMNSMSLYYNNNNENKNIEFEKIINNIDELINKNENNRNWKVIDLRNNTIVYKFNSEELFIFLKTIINNKEDKNFFIGDSDTDILFNPIKIYEDLKIKYQKNN